MKPYLSLLRGINVGGHKKIKMQDLQSIYVDAGFTAVKTYIQSGNVVFLSNQSSAAQIEKTIQEKIKASIGYDVDVAVKTMQEWHDIVSNNPFILNQTKEFDVSKLHITLLSEQPDKQSIAMLNSLEKKNGEELHFFQQTIYQYHPNGYSRTKFHNTFFENKLKTSATTRNWRTTMKLQEMINQIGKD